MTPSVGNNRTITLLLIEDDRVDQMAFNRMIRDKQPSYRILLAGSLAEARTILKDEHVDIVVCDFYLGDGTPFEIIPDLAKAEIPVIVVSGAEDENSAADAIRKGAYDYIVKDQNYNYLKALPLTIEKALGAGRPAAIPGEDPACALCHADADLPERALFSEKDEIHFRRLVIDQSELIARYRPDGTILFVNDVYCRYFGKARGELIGQPFESFLPEEDRRIISRQRSLLGMNNPALTFEHSVHLPSGSMRWIRRTDRALFDDNGNTVEYQMVAIDITDQKLAEEALRESEERYRMLAEYAFDGILIQDFSGTILYVNQSIVRMFGYTRVEDVLGMNSISFIAPEFRETAVRDLQNVIGGNQGYLQKYRALKPGGEEIVLESVGTLITYHGQKANIVALRDVTERENAELRLRKELDRKKDFINVAAHELRTPLQPVIGYLDLLLDDGAGYGLPPDAKNILMKVRTYVESERHMVSQILELSLLESVHEHYWPQMGPVALRDLAELVVRQGNYGPESGIRITIPETLEIVSNAPYIHEILDELISNAVTYSDPPRAITVAAEENGRELFLSVTDNGTGIPPEKCGIIFEPFYISDADKLSRKYGRLGVGLTMARNRASRLGGALTVKSTVGKGSTFTLALPKNPAA